MKKVPPPAIKNPFEPLFAPLAGLIFGLVLAKIGNPVIFGQKIASPANEMEMIFLSWPINWGYGLLVPMLFVGLVLFGKWQAPFRPWLFYLPLAWLGWQFVAAFSSVDARLTQSVLLHFSACVACFYLGRMVMARVENLRWFWAGLLAAFAWILWTGWEQQCGGLEETRKQFAQIDWSTIPQKTLDGLDTPEFRARLMSNRIFSTFVYPNALAVGLLLFFPPLFYLLWRWSLSRYGKAGIILPIMLATPTLGCLYWSGSKTGWAVALIMGIICLAMVRVSRTVKLGMAGGLLLVGALLFFLRFSAYFEKGATSLSARFDYWKAAVQVVKERPLTGSGPGTFGVSYRRLKPPETEMARLTHNDYLEQASDSGIPGAAVFLALWLGGLAVFYKSARNQPITFMVWLGLVGYSLQGFMEFSLYIPALAWPAFLLLGWLSGKDEGLQNPQSGARNPI